MTRTLAREVHERAKGRCEYCRLPSDVYPLPFHFDHIVARQHGGRTVSENLALACLHCNLHKGPNIAGADPTTGEIARLSHPRIDEWRDRFEWAGAALRGITVTGRVTIHVLAVNDPDFLAMRRALIDEQTFSTD